VVGKPAQQNLWERTNAHITPGPNKAVEPTPNSLRSCVAAALGRGSPRAFGFFPD